MRKVLVSLLSGVLVLSAAAVGGAAQLVPRHQGPPSPADRATTESGRALIKQDYPAALTAAELALQIAPNDPWAHYDRAAALRGLGRTDEAVAEFQRAQVLFGDRDPWGKSVALWGQADTLDRAGQCPQAAQAYDAFAGFVRSADPASADMAQRYAAGCIPRR